MKIGIFTDRYLPQADGVAFSIEMYRRRLEAEGHEIYIIAPKPSWRYTERSDRVIRFRAVKGLFFDDYLTTIFFPPQAIAEIDKLGIELVHFQTPGQIGLLGAYYAIRRGLPLVTTYHTDLHEYVRHYPWVLPGTIALSLLAPIIVNGGRDEYREAIKGVSPVMSAEKWNQKIVARNLTLLHNHCDLVITPSTKIQNQLESWGTKTRIVTLPTGVDRLEATGRELAAVRRRLNWHQSDQIVLLVCRIGTEKKVELLIEAFERVAAQLPHARLVVVGTGDDLERYEKMAAATAVAGRITFTGFVERHKLGAYYDLASVFAFPSMADTQGMAINEAASAGLPIVMVDREISEVVKEGQNGLFADPTPEDLAAKIITILTDKDLRKRFSARSMELAGAFSEESQATKMIKLYEETLARKQVEKS